MDEGSSVVPTVLEGHFAVGFQLVQLVRAFAEYLFSSVASLHFGFLSLCASSMMTYSQGILRKKGVTHGVLKRS